MSSKRSKRAASPSGSEGDSSRSSSPAPPKAKSHKRRRSVSRSRSRSVSPASSASSSSASDSGSESDGGFLGEAPAPPRARRPEAASSAAATAASPPSDNLRELRALVERSPPSSSPAASKQSKKKKPAAAASGAPHRVTHSKTVGTVIGLAAGDPINRDTIKIGRLVDFGGQRYVMTEMPRTGFHPCPPKVDADGAKKSVGVAKFPSSADAAMHKHHISVAPLIDNDPKKPDLSRRESIVVCSDGGAHLVSASLGRVMVNNSVKSSDIKGWKTYASRLDFLIRENLTGGSTNDKCKHAIVPWSTYYAEKKAAADGKAGAADDEVDGPTSVTPSASAAATAPAPKGGRRRPAAASASAAAAQGATHVSLAAHLEMADCYLRRPIQKYMQAEAERAHQSMSVMAKSWKQTCIDKLSPLDEQAATAHWKGVTAIECACQIVLFMTPEGGRLLDKWIADLTEQETRSYKLESAIMGAPPAANGDKAEKAGVKVEAEEADVKVEELKVDQPSSDDGDDPYARKMQSKSSKKSSKSRRVKSEDEEEEEEDERPLSKKEKREARRELKAAKKAKKEHRKKKKRRTEKKETSGDDDDDDDDEKKESAQTPPASESDAASDTEMAAAAASSSEEAASGADASDAVSDSE